MGVSLIIFPRVHEIVEPLSCSHKGKQRLNASSHLGLPRNRILRVSSAQNRFFSFAQKSQPGFAVGNDVNVAVAVKTVFDFDRSFSNADRRFGHLFAGEGEMVDGVQLSRTLPLERALHSNQEGRDAVDWSHVI